MRLLATFVAIVPLFAWGDESYFFSIAASPSGERIEGNTLHIELPIQRIDAPVASSISAFHQGLGPGRKYKIQVTLEASPPKGWKPMLKLGDEIIMEGVSVAVPDHPRFASSFSLEDDDPERIIRWCQHLRELLKVAADRVKIDLTEGKRHGADQPATVPASTPEGSEKRESESEARSR